MERSHRTIVITATTTLIVWFSLFVAPVVLITALWQARLAGVVVAAALAACAVVGGAALATALRAHRGAIGPRTTETESLGTYQLLAEYLALTFLASWLPSAVMLLQGAFSLPLVILQGSGPLVAAAALTYRETGSLRPLWARITRWRTSIRWYAMALVLPVVLLGVALAGLVILGGPGVPAGTPPWLTVPLLFLFVLLLGGGQEEPGWRGFGLPLLQRRYGALTASLLLGAIWAVWHLPLFVIPGSPQAELSFLPYAVMALALSVVFTSMYNATAGSVPVVMVLHAMVNLVTAWYPATVGALPQILLALVAWVWAGGVIVRYGPRELAPIPRQQLLGRVGERAGASATSSRVRAAAAEAPS